MMSLWLVGPNVLPTKAKGIRNPKIPPTKATPTPRKKGLIAGLSKENPWLITPATVETNLKQLSPEVVEPSPCAR